MLLYILLGVLFFVSAQSGNLPSVRKDDKLNSNISTVDDLITLNKTNMAFVSEGGTLLTNTPVVMLPKKQSNNLFSLEEEGSKEKDKGVVARKGAPQTPDIDQINSLKPNVTTVVKQDTVTLAKDSSANSLVSNNVKTDLSNKTEEIRKINTTEVPKKPRILSAEALAKTDLKIKSEQLKLPVAPSTKTMANSQIPSPNDDSPSIIKVYPSKASSHPGMIMPIVITILVVPMFAIVGYMALKRGQEAWKNRHYKRMDFLLDGMYND